MKVKWNEKYTTVAVYSLIVIFLSIIFYQITSHINIFKLKLIGSIKIFNPFIIGFVMAYLFNFIMVFYEKLIAGMDNKVYFKKKKSKRVISLVLTYITVIILIYIFSNFVFPQVISSITGIINNIPIYIEGTSKLLLEINNKFSLNDEYARLVIQKWNEFINLSINYIGDFVPKFANFIRNTISSIWNIVLGIIVSIYLLVDKERFIGGIKKTTKALFSKCISDKLIRITNKANFIFSRFLGGKILDSLIISILTFIVLWIVKMPYSLLISFIIGITNIIPFFGPFIGAIPSTIIILFESPIKAVWFIIIILIIQQIDGNIIGPKILGDSLGISAFWILFSLLITGKLFGFIGLIIGVPLFTLIYSIFKDFIENRLEKKGLPKETYKYIKKED